MKIIVDNFEWMTFNVVLSLLPILFAYLFLKTKNDFLKVIFFGIWLVFIPNTIYLITDLKHLIIQVDKFDIVFDLLLIMQYIALTIIGVISYVYALNPIVEFVKKRIFKQTDVIIIGFNFVISFGVALGRFERTQSWNVISQPLRVINDINSILMSTETLLFVLLFGTLVNLIWFYWKRRTA